MDAAHPQHNSIPTYGWIVKAMDKEFPPTAVVSSSIATELLTLKSDDLEILNSYLYFFYDA